LAWLLLAEKPRQNHLDTRRAYFTRKKEGIMMSTSHPY
jgi:hypothetical protein